MKCRCEMIDVLTGAEAKQYRAEHLEEVEVDPENWITIYSCPVT